MTWVNSGRDFSRNREPLVGGLVSLISSLSFLDNAPANFIAFTMAGMTFGLLIELVATKGFKAPQEV